MGVGLDEYRGILVNNILLATSHEDVENVIDTAMLAMERDNINKHIIARLVGKVKNDFESFTLVPKQTQQSANIVRAKILLTRIWLQLNTPTE